jgi:thiamine biosynthesis protein ThiS
MPARLKFRDKKFEVNAGMTVRDALQKMNIEPDTVLITRNGELITDDEILLEGDEIKLIAVISGG